MQRDDVGDLRIQWFERQAFAPPPPGFHVAAAQLIAAGVGEEHDASLAGRSGRLRLGPEGALRHDHAVVAARRARHADMAAMQYQPVMRMLQELLWRYLQQLLFHLQRGCTRRKSGAVGYAEHMR